MLSALWHWVEVHTGTINESGPYYGFWSGFGSDLGEITILGAVIGLFRAKNCHVHRCLRLGKHAVDGTPYVVCRKHHPAMTTEKPTAHHIRHEHSIAQRNSAEVS